MAEIGEGYDRPYEKGMLWQKSGAAHKEPALWQEPSHKFGDIPEPLYRLRLSVLKDGRGGCPTKMFVFPSVHTLTHATENLKSTFGGAFSTIKFEYRGVDDSGNQPSADGQTEAVEDGRTGNLVMKFDSQMADESWKEFLGRLEKLEDGWTAETP